VGGIVVVVVVVVVVVPLPVVVVAVVVVVERLFKFVMFFVGFSLSGWGTMNFFEKYNSRVATEHVFLISLTLALFGGRLLLVMTKVSVVFVGALSGIVFTQGLWLLIFEEKVRDKMDDTLTAWLHSVLLTCVGLSVAVLLFKKVNVLLKSVTAFIGGFFIVSGGVYFWSEISMEDLWFSPERFLWISETSIAECDKLCVTCYIFWLLLFILGFWFQHRGMNLCRSQEFITMEMRRTRSRRVKPKPEIDGRPVNIHIALRRRPVKSTSGNAGID